MLPYIRAIKNPIGTLLPFFLLIFLGSSCDVKIEPIELKNIKTQISIAPFAFDEASAQFENHFTEIFVRNLEFADQSRKWDYGEKFSENIDREKLFCNPIAVAKFGHGRGSDLVFIGKISRLKIQEKLDETPIFHMDRSALPGSTRFVTVYQWATVKIELKAIEVATKKVIWKNNGFTGYIKYIREFQSQDPNKYKIRVSEKQILADIRRHMALQLGHQIFPNKIPKRPIPEILAEPQK